MTIRQPLLASTMPAKCNEPQINTRAGPGCCTTSRNASSTASDSRAVIPTERADLTIWDAGCGFSSPGIVTA